MGLDGGIVKLDFMDAGFPRDVSVKIETEPRKIKDAPFERE